MSKAEENKRKIPKKTRPMTPCSIKSSSTTKKMVRDYFVSVPKTELVVRVALTEENQVLGSPLTASTQRVELTTSSSLEKGPGAGQVPIRRRSQNPGLSNS